MDNNNEVNVMFMQNVLRQNKEYDTIVVRRVRVEQACEKGENFASIVLRVHVEGYKSRNSNVGKLDSSSVILFTLAYNTMYKSKRTYNNIEHLHG